ncbi:MAG: hypothetical protein FWD68_09745 [Alphaproteobacteria bacterium]|nr:hypothetical protein [Alphaproteobacteria bacterium]
MVNVPLLLLALAVYNIVAVLIGQPLDAEAFRLPLMAGQEWVVRAGDLMIGGSIVLLLGETIRNSRPPGRDIMTHLLSLMVLAGAICEFVLWPKAFGNSVFFFLILLMTADFVGGIAQRARRAGVAAAPTPSEPQVEPQLEPRSEPQVETRSEMQSTLQTAQESVAMRPVQPVEPQISTGPAPLEGATIQMEKQPVATATEPSLPG